ncbi:hypothetical protein, variant [Verruconis gallopava]|uniref:DUF788 domain-containing protein n=1 Tax=Verruconis gallopava TaxID=253628 RepID=A0A0D1YVD8_9PEZI|nr:uncharacterized protein PV09_04396 [Verruconis gallopava]XP_016214521.1 hypothetical protein, variant [Verruconis gallopava]KIW04651.1 hypothetical protein PV09_04396 [Verruconis gallopava]KIW04652.1 hypothetical protein, variant [Verruconis gallopava]
MAQKAKKELAARNAAKLNQTLYFSISVHTFFILLRLLLFRHSFTTRSLILYLVLSTPSFLIHFWLERIGRPTYTPPSSSSTSEKGDLKSAGEDLDAKGLTEFLWDVTYWTWGCVVFAAAFGDRAWWLYLVIPAYAVYLAYTTFMGAKRGMAGFGGISQGEEGISSGVGSKRQMKMEKRGGQKAVYR